MSKEMELTEDEQKTFKLCMMLITNLLMIKKKESEFFNPQIRGSADIDGEDVTFFFDFRIETKNISNE